MAGPQLPPHSAAEQRFPELSKELAQYFRRRGVEPQEIEDLVQQVFVRLAARGGLDALQNFDGYAQQTAASVLIDRSRRRAVRQHDAHVELDSERHGAADIGPEQIVADREALDVAMAALMALPERTRTIFVLRRLEGVRYRNIAERLGISVSAVEKHMARAIEHMLSVAGEVR